jgi:hypothetical protein
MATGLRRWNIDGEDGRLSASAIFEAVCAIFVAVAVEIDHQHPCHVHAGHGFTGEMPVPPEILEHDRRDPSVAPSLPVASNAGVRADRLARSRT